MHHEFPGFPSDPGSRSSDPGQVKIDMNLGQGRKPRGTGKMCTLKLLFLWGRVYYCIRDNITIAIFIWNPLGGLDGFWQTGLSLLGIIIDS